MEKLSLVAKSTAEKHTLEKQEGEDAVLRYSMDFLHVCRFAGFDRYVPAGVVTAKHLQVYERLLFLQGCGRDGLEVIFQDICSSGEKPLFHLQIT